MAVSTIHPFMARTQAALSGLHDSGQHKSLQMIQGPMGPTVKLRDYGECLCFCSNNYLGLSNHPEVVEAAHQGLRDFGNGTSSVRFICGTFSPHEKLEQRIAQYMDAEASYTFVSCWNANEAIFPTLCEPGDAIISDELNHASIIDAIRLATTITKGIRKGVFKHSDMNDLRRVLTTLQDDDDFTGVIWVVTDGVFSMEGDLANLPELRAVCDESQALLVVDDSHAHGVMGKTGRGTHEHYDMPGSSIDFFTGTLGKALGGAAGGFIAGPASAIDMIIQRGRPTLFSNALPVPVACAADKAIEILMREPQLVQTLRDNTAYARDGIRKIGLEVIESPAAICPIIVGATADAIAKSKRLLELGVFVIGFGYPVVPEGTARLRVQISAAHTHEHLDALIEALAKL
jgi:glycine C-acetyltransferase